MKIETKYSIGDTVYGIQEERKEKLIACPTCVYGTIRDGMETKWVIYGQSEIGKIRPEIYANKQENYYMLESTGIGSKTLWKECNLFLRKESAQIECNRRNKPKENKAEL